MSSKMGDQTKTDGRAKSLSFWASELGCSLDTLIRATMNKELLAWRHPTARGRPYMARAEDISAFLERRRSNSV